MLFDNAIDQQHTWNVWHRKNRKEPWRVAGTAASQNEATALMYRLMDNQAGDWLTLEASKPDPNIKRFARKG